jgi:hypothetical protein
MRGTPGGETKSGSNQTSGDKKDDNQGKLGTPGKAIEKSRRHCQKGGEKESCGGKT